MKFSGYKIVCLFIVTLFCALLFSQTTYQVVSRKIEKEFAFTESDRLTINAEKGIIDIQAWNEKKVSVVVTIVVKNRDISSAKKELEYINWTANRKNKELLLLNTILLPPKAELSSIVRVEYKIRIPQGTQFSIDNKFGQVNITNANCEGKYTLEYCDLNIKNVTGSATITSKLGDFNITNFSGLLKITSRYSSIQLTNISGKSEISATYGDVALTFDDEISTINITAERCNVKVTNKNCREISLDLETKYGELYLPETCYIKNKTLLSKSVVGSSPTSISTCKYSTTGKSINLKVKSSYGNITLN
jgi:hypothetical protein